MGGPIRRPVERARAHRAQLHNFPVRRAALPSVIVPADAKRAPGRAAAWHEPSFKVVLWVLALAGARARAPRAPPARNTTFPSAARLTHLKLSRPPPSERPAAPLLELHHLPARFLGCCCLLERARAHHVFLRGGVYESTF
jgi:hypothetical protein